MAFTKGELLRHAIAFALRSVRLSGRRLGLTEDDRMRVAETLRACADKADGSAPMAGYRTAARGDANGLTLV
jgi:hypothetical protein